jgi:hypothetical protein
VATILVLAHEFDRFSERKFLIKALFPHWQTMGHTIVTKEGLSRLTKAATRDIRRRHLNT